MIISYINCFFLIDWFFTNLDLDVACFLNEVFQSVCVWLFYKKYLHLLFEKQSLYLKILIHWITQNFKSFLLIWIIEACIVVNFLKYMISLYVYQMIIVLFLAHILITFSFMYVIFFLILIILGGMFMAGLQEVITMYV